MKIFKGCLLALLLSCGSALAQTAYDNDVTNFYVSDNGTNNALKTVNKLICYMNAMAPDLMVNRGNYVATIYEDLCKKPEGGADDAAAAQPTSAQNASSGASSGSSGASAAADRETFSATTGVTRADATDGTPMVAKVWVNEEAEPPECPGCMVRPAQLIYVRGTSTAAPSETSRFGDFTMEMTFTLAEAMDDEFGSMPAGSNVGGGYLAASANSVTFIMNGMNAPPEGLFASFTGDRVSGVYNQETWICAGEYCADGFPVQLIQKFSLDESDEVYCSELISSNRIDFTNPDPDTGGPALIPYTPTAEDGIATTEQCFSLAIEDAQRSVHRYGVYNQDGSRLDLGQGGFPMSTEVTDGDGETVRIHAYADYWGVWFSETHASLVKLVGDEPATVFTKEHFGGEEDVVQPTYTIAQGNAKIEKVTKTFVALNELDGLTMGMYVEGGSPWWGDKYQTLGFPNENAEFQGSYTASTGVWSFDKKLTFNPSYTETDITPITFDNATWVSTMTRTEVGNPDDPNDDWTENRSLWAWSPDTGKGYDIRANAMSNPADGTQANGIIVNNNETLLPAQFPASLVCVEQCPTAALLNATIAAAVAGATGSTVASPYAPGNWPILTGANDAPGCAETMEGCNAGRWYQGILGTNTQTWTTSGLRVLDGTATELAVSAAITDPQTQLKGAMFVWPWEGNQTSPVAQGIQTGKLLLPADLAQLECEKNVAGTAYLDNHPEFPAYDPANVAGTIRYCTNSLYDADSPITTWYQVRFGANQWDRQRFIVDQATTEYVAFDPPTTLYYEVPDEARYGDDGGKRVSLRYSGFGDLQGIPGQVIDTRTGASLGEFFDGEWKNYYRYVQRFVLEPDANGTAPTLSTGGTTPTVYKVKPLEGEEWLLKDDTIIGTLPLTGVAGDLPTPALIVNVSPSDPENSIGELPTTGLLNDGDPSVIHGEVVITFD